MLRKKNFRGLTFLIVVFVAIGSLLPLDKMDLSLPSFFAVDKWVHMGMYFVLTLVALLGFDRSEDAWSKRVRIPVYTIAYGILIEFLQETLPVNRSADYYDVLANAFGSLGAWFVYRFIHKKYRAEMG